MPAPRGTQNIVGPASVNACTGCSPISVMSGQALRERLAAAIDDLVQAGGVGCPGPGVGGQGGPATEEHGGVGLTIAGGYCAFNGSNASIAVMRG
jgi:hypothetical protein